MSSVTILNVDYCKQSFLNFIIITYEYNWKQITFDYANFVIIFLSFLGLLDISKENKKKGNVKIRNRKK